MRHIVIRLSVGIIWLVAAVVSCAGQLSLCRMVCCFGHRLSSQRLSELEKGKRQTGAMRWTIQIF